MVAIESPQYLVTDLQGRLLHYNFVVPQLKSSWMGRKSIFYARVVPENNTPGPERPVRSGDV